MSAARADDAGETAFLQTSATVNPGNSGGPMVDASGFVLGVIRLKLKEGDGIGFAIPVNEVKDFLEVRGYLGLLGIDRLRLTDELHFEGKGLALRFPDSLEDWSPSRLRVLTDPRDSTVYFSAERVATPWEISRLEEILLGGDLLGSFRASGERRSSAAGAGGGVRGWASGLDVVSGREETLEYFLLDMGPEKMLVRYQGTVEAMAFNRSAVRASLASVRAQPFLAGPIDAPVSPDAIRWSKRPLPLPSSPAVELPEGPGWEEEVSAPFPCPGLPPLDSVLATSPAGDFTVSLRVGWWKRGPSPIEAARACSERPGPFGVGSYVYAVDWLGLGYTVSGRFERSAEEGLLQLEMVAPREKGGFVRDLGASFVERNARR
jgi:hypothetical protein